MKPITALYRIVATALLLLFCTPTTMYAELIDRIVAIVNSDIITLSDLNNEGSPYFKSIMRNVPTAQIEDEMEKARQEILSHLIDRLLIAQKATEYEIVVSDEEVESALNAMLAEKNISRDAFDKQTAETGDSRERYKEQIRTQILQQRLVNIEIRSKIVITEEKIRAYYEQQYAREQSKEGYHLFQIGLGWSGNGRARNKEEAYEIMKFLHDQLQSGESFQELAKSYSELPSAADGGDIGIIPLNEMAASMRDVVKTLNPGELSGIIESSTNYQLLKLLSVKSGDISLHVPYDAVKNEIREILFRQEMTASYDQWIDELRNKAYIKENI